jgi:hypothetical protein
MTKSQRQAVISEYVAPGVTRRMAEVGGERLSSIVNEREAGITDYILDAVSVYIAMEDARFSSLQEKSEPSSPPIARVEHK